MHDAGLWKKRSQSWLDLLRLVTLTRREPRFRRADGQRYNRPVSRVSLLAALTLLLAVVPVAGGKVEGTAAKVTITRAACAVWPQSLTAGPVTFRIMDRSRRPATFSLAGKRATVAAGRAARLVVILRAGRVAYACTIAGRRIGGGFLRVAPPAPSVAKHQIGVRQVNGFDEFFDSTTGAKFVPRGNNYIRVAPLVDTFGRTQVSHSTFNVARYDSAQADAALARMAAAGYNVVRVFLNNTCARGCSANMTTGAISSSYVANLVDFLRHARARGVFVILTAEWLPSGAVYDAIAGSIRRDWFDNINLIFLAPQGIEMSVRFWRDLIRELVRQHAPLDAIFAYSLWNEAHVTFDNPPFTLSSGRITTANGQTYDMASAAEQARMIDDGFVYYTDEVRAAILEVDPTGS